MQGEKTLRRSILFLLLFVGLAFHNASGQTNPTTITVDGQGATPFITLQTNLSAGNKSGFTAHQIFGPYATTSGDPGALYIGAGQSPVGGKNNIFLYNLGCNGGCNVPKISLFADTTALNGNLSFPDGTTQTTAAPVIRHTRINASSCTSGTVGAEFGSCSLTWPGNGFADVNYTAVCTTNEVLIVGVTSKTNSGATIGLQNVGGFIGSGVEFDCIAIHD